MKIKGYTGDNIQFEFYKEGYYRLTNDVKLEIHTDEGVMRYEFLRGFVTDLRSGSNAINPIIPKFTGNNLYNLAIIAHDFNYTKMASGEPPVSKKLADELLSKMTEWSKTLSWLQRKLMIGALTLFGGSAYGGPNKKPYDGIEQFMKFSWDDK